MLFLCLSFLPFGIVKANWCEGLGAGLEQKTEVSPIYSVSVLADVGNRDYTLFEVFPVGAARYGVPYGHNETGTLFKARNESVKDLLKDKDGDGLFTEDVEEVLEARYSRLGLCFMPSIFTTIQTIFSNITFLVTKIINLTVTTVFDTHFICENSTDVGCMDLLGVAGGESNSDGGLIKLLSTSIFMPFAVLMMLFTSLWLMYKGLIKREIRATFGGVAWTLFAFLLGIYVLVRPFDVARLPQTINTNVVGCLVAAFSGENCLGGESKDLKLNESSAKPCLSLSSQASSINDKLQLSINSLTCTISKGYVIDRWAEQQFGYSFDELYTKNAPVGYKEYPEEKLIGTSDDYCVNMHHDKAPKDLEGSLVFSSKKQVCNIALAYMANKTIGDFGNKANMGYIIGTATLDERMWAAFTGDGRDPIGVLSLLGVVITAISFLPVAFYSHIFSIVATLLMVFSPIFLLLALHPGKGRKIFLGWLQTVLSSILKYIASAFLLIVMIAMYSAITSSLSGGMVFISSLVLCVTFINYRKELLDLVGTVDMGGAALSNRFGEMAKSLGKKTKTATGVVAGSAIGGTIAEAKNGGSLLKGVGKGIGKGVTLELSRGRGLVSSAIRAGKKVNTDIEKKKEAFARDVKDEARRQDTIRDISNTKSQITDSNAQTQEATDRLMFSNQKDTALTINTSNLNSIQGLNDSFREQVGDMVKDTYKSSTEAEHTKKNIRTERAIKEVATIQRGIDSQKADEARETYIAGLKKEYIDLVARNIAEVRNTDEYKKMSKADQKSFDTANAKEELKYLKDFTAKIESLYQISNAKSVGKDGVIVHYKTQNVKVRELADEIIAFDEGVRSRQEDRLKPLKTSSNTL